MFYWFIKRGFWTSYFIYFINTQETKLSLKIFCSDRAYKVVILTFGNFFCRDIVLSESSLASGDFPSFDMNCPINMVSQLNVTYFQMCVKLNYSVKQLLCYKFILLKNSQTLAHFGKIG